MFMFKTGCFGAAAKQRRSVGNSSVKRDSIDRAGLAQFDRKLAALRCVERSGGKDCWSHMFSHGHKYATIRSLVSKGYLKEPRPYHYELTDDSRAFLADVDIEAMKR